MFCIYSLIFYFSYNVLIVIMSENRNIRQLIFYLSWELAAFLTLVCSIIFLWQNNLLLFIIVIMECLTALWFWHERYDLCFFSIASILGTFAELVFVSSGIWLYTNPTLYGIPLWFPVAFGTTALISQRLSHTLTMIWNTYSSKHSVNIH